MTTDDILDLAECQNREVAAKVLETSDFVFETVHLKTFTGPGVTEIPVGRVNGVRAAVWRSCITFYGPGHEVVAWELLARCDGLGLAIGNLKSGTQLRWVPVG